MSKPIKMTEAFKNECRADFEKALNLVRLTDGKVTFTKVFDGNTRKAKVLFTPVAWAKMLRLIMVFDKEVAWHGVARRGDDPDKDEYIISDILVYPQKVTAAHVDMDPVEYAKWIMEHDEDDRFSNIRMQGHSHVRMGTTPSGTDIQHQEDIVNMLNDNDFYIFMIWNKYLTSTFKIFDLQKNVLFEDSDITWEIASDGDSLTEFMDEAKRLVVDSVSVQSKGVIVQYPSQKSSQPQTPATPSETAKSAYNSPYDPYRDYKANTPPANEKAGGVVSKETPTPAAEAPAEKKRVRIGAGWGGKDATEKAAQGTEDDGFGYGYGYHGYHGYSGYAEEYLGGR